jgi:hypothetical protein
MARLERRRESISGLDEDAFDSFVQKDHDARSEKTVMSTVFPIIRGSADIPFGEEKLFGNLDPLAEGIVSAKPDFMTALWRRNVTRLFVNSLAPLLFLQRKTTSLSRPTSSVRRRGRMALTQWVNGRPSIMGHWVRVQCLISNDLGMRHCTTIMLTLSLLSTTAANWNYTQCIQ